MSLLRLIRPTTRLRPRSLYSLAGSKFDTPPVGGQEYLQYPINLPGGQTQWRCLSISSRRSQFQNSPLLPDDRPDDEPPSTKQKWGPTLFKMFESAVTTLASVTVLGYVRQGVH